MPKPYLRDTLSNVKNILIQNKKARFDYHILEKFVAGIVLSGSEIKSIRAGKANIKEGYCYFVKNELWVKNIHISEYYQASYNGHRVTRERKLLLTKKELKKLKTALNEKGLTIVPLKLFINERGWAKLEIGLAKGKKVHDKRHTIKQRDIQREMDRR